SPRFDGSSPPCAACSSMARGGRCFFTGYTPNALRLDSRWIGRALRARGHDVVMVTGGPFEDVARRAGLGFQGMFSTEEYEAATNHPDLWHPRRGLQIVMRLVASRLEFAYTRLKEVYEPGRTVLVGHALSFVTRLL